MLFIPAIDLYKGKVVRFVKGEPSQSTVYSDDPVAIAEKFKKEGVQLIHVIDLSAALGEGSNLNLMKEIIDEVDIDVEVGGGIRDVETAKKIISFGTNRIIVGTKSLDGDFLKELIKNVGLESLAVSVDVKEGVVATRGWKEKSSTSPINFIEDLAGKGIKWIIYTDISRDGTLSGVNLDAMREFSRFKSINFIASGGVSSLNDLKKIKEELPFIWGVISGKAIYDNKINIKEANALLT